MTSTDRDEIQYLTFTEEHMKRLLDTPSILTLTEIRAGQDETNDWDTLVNLNKKLIRTDLHGVMMREYCREKVVPQGLIVRNEPRVFTDNNDFKRKWSQISNTCSRDWLLLIVDTAAEMTKKVNHDILTLEEKWKGNTLPHIKKKLDDIKLDIIEFKNYTIQKKIDKLRKDITEWSMERMYPYLKQGHYDKSAPKWTNNRGRSWGRGIDRQTQQRRHVTFSDSSNSTSILSDDDDRQMREGQGNTSGGSNDGFLYRQGTSTSGPFPNRTTRSQYKGRGRIHR